VFNKRYWKKRRDFSVAALSFLPCGLFYEIKEEGVLKGGAVDAFEAS